MSRDPDGRQSSLTVTTELLWALAKEGNRRVIQLFEQVESEEIHLDEVAEYLAANSSGKFQNDPQKIKIRLHHTSLPQLTEIGLIEYDPDAKVVRQQQIDQLPEDLKEDLFALDDDRVDSGP